MAITRFLVTGASGMLGKQLVSYLNAKGYEVKGTTRSELDLLGTEEAIKATISTFKPQVIIHTAALTNVDTAETDPDLAMAINKDGTRKLVLAAKECDAIVAYISTDYVFDGLKKSPYTVSDRPNPINMYGLSKYYGELMVTELMDTFYIIRVSWLYGIHRNNFVQFVLDSAKSGTPVKAADDMLGTGSWTGSLSPTIENIVTSGSYGTYHACDEGVISRFEQAQAVCKIAGLPTTHITPIKTKELPLKANRPLYTPLDPSPLSVPGWETSLHAYVEDYKSNHNH